MYTHYQSNTHQNRSLNAPEIIQDDEENFLENAEQDVSKHLIVNKPYQSANRSFEAFSIKSIII